MQLLNFPQWFVILVSQKYWTKFLVVCKACLQSHSCLEEGQAPRTPVTHPSSNTAAGAFFPEYFLRVSTVGSMLQAWEKARVFLRAVYMYVCLFVCCWFCFVLLVGKIESRALHILGHQTLNCIITPALFGGRRGKDRVSLCLNCLWCHIFIENLRGPQYRQQRMTFTEGMTSLFQDV